MPAATVVAETVAAAAHVAIPMTAATAETRVERRQQHSTPSSRKAHAAAISPSPRAILARRLRSSSQDHVLAAADYQPRTGGTQPEGTSVAGIALCEPDRRTCRAACLG